MPESAAARNRPSHSNRGRPELRPDGPGRRNSSSPGLNDTTTRRLAGRPGGGPPAPGPVRRHRSDLAAITLVSLGLLLLLSLHFGGPSVHIGTLLYGALGWGAPGCGIALILLGGLVAAGPQALRAGEVRAGILILFVGFLGFAALIGIDAAGHGGHGGDVGHVIMAGLRGLLLPLVGRGAWYPCAHVIVAAVNIVGFLVLTGKPLSHWGRLGHKAGQKAGRGVAQQYAVRTARKVEPAPPPISDNSRTRRSRQRAMVDLPGDSIPPARPPLSEGSAGADQSSSSDAATRSVESNEEGSEGQVESSGEGRPTRFMKEGPRRSFRSGLTAALDTLLPAAEPLPGEEPFTVAAAVAAPGNDLNSEEPLADPPALSLEETVERDLSERRVSQKRKRDDAGVTSDLSPQTEDNSPTDGTADKVEPAVPSILDKFKAKIGQGNGAVPAPKGELTKIALTGNDPASGPNGRTTPGEETPSEELEPGSRDRMGDTSLPLHFSDGPLPPPSLLNDTPPPPKKTEEEARATVLTLERTLQEFKVEAKVVEIAEGPTLTRYEIQLAPGILVKRILSLADNIAMALAAIDVRVEAPIPGKSAIGVEIPKRNPGVVGLREMVETPEFQRAPRLSFALGRDVTGTAQYADLARMPHLLIAGSTGAGKSACLNALITSLLFRAEPEDLQFVMIDPKRVELSLYDGIPHLCHQIVRDSRKAPQALGRVLAEMDRRYLLLQNVRTRDITGYNLKAETKEQKLPYIVVVIDELADLMMTSGAETEHAITRLAQLARAVGIHLVVATQRPSVDIVTGKIKANVSSRIAFAVSSGIDSRTILDCMGAERLIGRGDMLFLPMDVSKPRRIQGAYISEQELERVVEFWRSRGRPDYYLERMPTPESDMEPTGDAEDDMYTEAVRVVLSAGQASTSMIQRRLKIGYNRAATLVELMEQHGVVGAQDGVRPREVLISREQWDLSRGGGM